MGFDDILDDVKDKDNEGVSPETALEILKLRFNYKSEQIESAQALISKKEDKSAFSVEREFINSKEFHDIFEKLPLNKNVQESLYYQAGRLLEFVDKYQGEERMLAIDARTGEFIVDNFDRPGQISGTGFTLEEEHKIELCKNNIIVMHNHSYNGPPSAQDLLTYLHNDKIKISFIMCNDGTLYGIYSVKKEFEKFYDECLKQAKEHTSDIDDAKLIARSMFYDANEQLGGSKRLFDVRMFGNDTRRFDKDGRKS